MTGSGGMKRNVLSFDEIIATVEEVTDLAIDQEACVALAGGVAMQVYDSPRFTNDVDFLADKPIDGLRRIRRLSFGGIQGKATSGVSVDFIVRNDAYRTLYEHALENAVRIAKIPTLVVSPEYLAVIKLAAGRVKDLEDLRYLLVEYDKFNYKRARKIAKDELGFYAADDLDSYKKSFEIERQMDTAPKRRR
jgi:hypothetical protein